MSDYLEPEIGSGGSQRIRRIYSEHCPKDRIWIALAFGYDIMLTKEEALKLIDILQKEVHTLDQHDNHTN